MMSGSRSPMDDPYYFRNQVTGASETSLFQDQSQQAPLLACSPAKLVSGRQARDRG